MIHLDANVSIIYSLNGNKTKNSDPNNGSEIEFSDSMTLYAANIITSH